MRAPRPAPAPYTPKRALNSGSSAGAAATLGTQKLAGKNDLFAFSSAFLTGYLAGIPLGRFELHGAFTSLTEHVMAAQSYTAWLLNCLPELVLSAFMLWLAHSSCRVSQSLSSIVFSGCRCALNGAIRRLSVHYLLCLLGCAVSSFMFSGSAVLFASVLL